MLLPVIEQFLSQNPDLHILITSGTTTSAALLAKRLPHRAFHQYVPLDMPRAVTQFLDHWAPDMAIWAESEIWPNLIRFTHKRGIPMALINARLSEASLDRWRKHRKTAQALFGCFDKILAADERTANSLSVLLGQNIEASGNLKDAAPPLPVDPVELAEFNALLENRPVWCAASTHEGEDALFLKAHQHILNTHKNALLILAPRHPERRNAIISDIENLGLSHVSRSDRTRPGPKTSVYFFDSLGEMGLAYSLSKISFVGGSLIKGMSGHNPLEPARLHNAVLTGSYISSFAETYMSMFAFSAATRIFNPDMIGEHIANLFDSEKERQDLSNAAYRYATSRDAVLDYVMAELTPLFEGRA